MPDDEERILHDTERVWILIILLGCLWLGSSLPAHKWIVLAVTGLLAVLFLLPAGNILLRRPPVFTATATILAGLVVAQVVNAILQIMGIYIFSEVLLGKRAVFVGMAAVLAMLTLGGALLVFRLPHRRIEWPGATFRQTAGGLLVPLTLCAVAGLWIHTEVKGEIAFPVRATAMLLFLFHVYAFWPRRRPLLRWLFLVLPLLAPLGSGGVGHDIWSGARFPVLGAVGMAIVGFFWAFLDIVRAVVLLDDPTVRTFFLGEPLTQAFDFTAFWAYRLVGGLILFEQAGACLSPILALALPALIAVRLVRGETRGRWLLYVLAGLVFSVATVPLFGSRIDIDLYRPVFLRELRLAWLTQALPFQAILGVALLASAALSKALSGRAESAEPPEGTTKVPPQCSGETTAFSFLRWAKAHVPSAFSERRLLPVLCAILVLSGLVGGWCTFVANRHLGSFRGTVDSRPGQVAAAPILAPLFTQRVSPITPLYRIALEARRAAPNPGGFNPDDYPLYTGRGDPATLPDAAACDRLITLSKRADVRRYLDAFERAADAHVCAWRILSPDNRCASPHLTNLRQTGGFISGRASVAMAGGRWDEVRRDIGRLIRLGAILGSEGDTRQRLIGLGLQRNGVRCAFAALQNCPRDQVMPFAEQLRALHPWERRLLGPKALEEAEPFLAWPARLIFPDELLPRISQPAMTDQCHVAEFRLLLLASAAKAYFVTNGRLPQTMEELDSLLGSDRPIDPISGNEFEVEFSPEYVRFRTSGKGLLRGFIPSGTAFVQVLPTRQLMLTVKADGTISVGELAPE